MRVCSKRMATQWSAVAGIGKALAMKCAEQGLNTVLVAKPDSLLDDTTKELTANFPELRFRKVPVDLGKQGYVDDVEAAIKDINVQVCFLNAGYIQTGLFEKTPLPKLYANLECNVGHVVGLSHLLVNRCVTSIIYLSL
jgi:short-subunit dehydrogenase